MDVTDSPDTLMYVHGVMDGEAPRFTKTPEGGIQDMPFNIGSSYRQDGMDFMIRVATKPPLHKSYEQAIS